MVNYVPGPGFWDSFRRHRHPTSNRPSDDFFQPSAMQRAMQSSQAGHQSQHACMHAAPVRGLARKGALLITRTSMLDKLSTAPAKSSGPTLCVPEDLQLPPGQLSTIDRVGKNLPADVFRCFGCTKEACQVSAQHMSTCVRLGPMQLQLPLLPHTGPEWLCCQSVAV